MYTPKHFEVRDPALLYALMERFSFATLVTIDNGVPVATHLPFQIKPDVGEHGVLISHMARANTQWRSFGDADVLTIFQGNHTYISPSWYAQHPSVPTWNYMVVHAYGRPRLIDDAAALVMLEQVIAKHEAGFEQPWTMTSDQSYVQKMLKGIVAFEIEITRLEGKFKLSQNRSERDQQQVIDALTHSSDPLEQELAKQMRALYANEPTFG